MCLCLFNKGKDLVIHYNKIKFGPSNLEKYKLKHKQLQKRHNLGDYVFDHSEHKCAP